jgi:co-chaperonin GroES (HSP10)
MKIKPASGQIYLKIDTPKIGVLQSTKDSAIEYAEVIEVADDIDTFKKGDKVFVKAWAIDTVTYEGKKYNFVNIESNGVLATVS